MAPTVGRGGGEREVLRGRGATQGYAGAREVDLGAAAGVGADLVVLVEVQLPGVHDLPARRHACVPRQQAVLTGGAPETPLDTPTRVLASQEAQLRPRREAEEAPRQACPTAQHEALGP